MNNQGRCKKYFDKIDEIKHQQEIDRISETSHDYEYFVENYLKLNIPCMFDKSLTTENWLSLKDWVTGDGNINWTFLKDIFDDCKVPVIDCNTSYDYDSVAPIDMKFSEFAAYMENKKDSSLYLKDWHCARQFPNYKFYDVPTYFKSDWLNEYWEDKDDDYKFVYIGPKGSWTPLHADVLRSYSWSANVCGRKRWVIHLQENINGNISSDKNDECVKLEVIQKAGEVIFIPSGWFHEVYNEEDTISINHNWINAYNINYSWKFLKLRLAEVEKEIEELKNEPDYHLQCQKILRADSGMDYIDFFNFLHFISSKRITEIENNKELISQSLVENGSSMHLKSCMTIGVETLVEHQEDHFYEIHAIDMIMNDLVNNHNQNSLNQDEHSFTSNPKHYCEFIHKFKKTESINEHL